MADRKRRTRQHVIADLGVNHVERAVLRCGWAAERVVFDYGIDLYAQVFSDDGFTMPLRIPIQVKSSDRPRRLKNGRSIAVQVEMAHVRAWLRETVPAVLVLYDASADIAYWLHLQQYFSDRPVPINQMSVVVQVEIANMLDERAVKALADLPRIICRQS